MNCSFVLFLNLVLVRLCLLISHSSLVAGTQLQEETKQPQENRYYKLSANSATVNLTGLSTILLLVWTDLLFS